MAISKQYKEKCLDYLYGFAVISSINTNVDLDMKVPNLTKEVAKIITNSMILLTSKNNMSQYKNVNLAQEMIYCTGITKPIALLRHLRNAIAHGYLKEDGNFFIIEDWDDRKKTKLTAKGRFSKKRIEDILDLLIPLA